MTQKQRIIETLRRRKNGATYGELTFTTGSTSPHKRIAEAERDGYLFDYYSEWRERKGERGAWVTRVVLAGEPKQAA
jgi:hypothetical protein